MNREEALKILINGESEPCYKTCDEDCGKVMICLNHKCKWAEAMDVIREALKDRPHGKWKELDSIVAKAKCSVCGGITVTELGEPNFCPNCGASMPKEGDPDDRA